MSGRLDMSQIKLPPCQSAPPVVEPGTPGSGRLLCLDVFRGLAVAGMIVVDNPGSDDLAYGPIKHADWNGWTSAPDFIFPSFPLSGWNLDGVLVFRPPSACGESRTRILWHAFKRSLILIAIGLFVNASPIIGLDLHTYGALEGVTQRIALCYLAAAILVLWSSQRGMWIALCACLLGYWALLRFVPVPGLGVPGHSIPFMDPDRNLAAWLDRKLFMGHLFDKTRDPEGILSTIPAIGTTLIRSADRLLAAIRNGVWARIQGNPHAVGRNSRLGGWRGFGISGSPSTRICGPVRSCSSVAASRWSFLRFFTGC